MDSMVADNMDNFNSQPHEEADEKYKTRTDLEYYISTHSLTKRLTHY